MAGLSALTQLSANNRKTAVAKNELAERERSVSVQRHALPADPLSYLFASLRPAHRGVGTQGAIEHAVSNRAGSTPRSGERQVSQTHRSASTPVLVQLPSQPTHSPCRLHPCRAEPSRTHEPVDVVRCSSGLAGRRCRPIARTRSRGTLAPPSPV